MYEVPVLPKKAGGDNVVVIGFQRYDDRSVHVKYEIKCFSTEIRHRREAYQFALFLLNKQHGDVDDWKLSDNYTLKGDLDDFF
jgi:hypothetical protein